MNTGDIVAYIGAAAWLPQIFQLFYRFFTKPKLKIYVNNVAEVSYTSFGPIFNIRMSLLSEKKPLLLENLTLEIKHSDGDTHILQWIGITEVHSEISDQNGNKQYITKDLPPIALKLSQDLLNEKLIKFQEPKFHKQDQALQNEVNSHLSFLINKNPDNYIQAIIESSQKHNLINFRENYFWWKKGTYSVFLKAESSESFNYNNNEITFTLSQTDIDIMKYNFNNNKQYVDDLLGQNGNPETIRWNWLYPKIEKK